MTVVPMGGFLRGLPPDDWHTPSVKQHSLDKISLHNQYAGLFNRAMKNKWPQRAYLGLYSGAGRAIVEPTGEIVETTAMSVFRLPDPFTHHIFVDNDPRCIEALQGRIGTLEGDPHVALIPKRVEDAVPDIKAALPPFSAKNGLLSLCFIDPFSADVDFSVIRELGQAFRMDFLILLMLGVDIRQNFRRYLEDETDTRIGKLIDDPNWRDDWAERGLRNRDLIRFVLEKFDAAMTRLGYEAQRPEESHAIRVQGKGVLLYNLVFYSRHPLAKKLFEAAKARTDPQTTLPL